MTTLIRRLLLCAALAGANLSFAADPAPAASAPKCWRWEEMKPADLAEALRTRPIAWLVLSPLEWHGEAIAFGADTIVGTKLAEGAWKQVGGVLIPTLYIGNETEYKEWDTEKGLVTRWGLELLSKQHNPGSIYVRLTTLELVLVDYLHALKREGFKYVVVLSGHGGTEHVKLLNEVCARDWGDMKVLRGGGGGGRGLPPNLQIPSVAGVSHANIGEASRVGGIDPKLVDPKLFASHERDRLTGLDPANADKIDFEKGKGILEHSINSLVARVKESIGDK
jgi:creatinine amidohydrolase